MTRSTAWSGLGVALLLLSGQAPANASRSQTPAGQPDFQLPTFRTATHFVRVDAYPFKDGRIIEGLTAADFDLRENGTPQKVETIEFIRYAGLTPESERRNPDSQRDSFQLAADPRYRLFVIYADTYGVGFSGSHNIRQPLTDMLLRILGPNDLFGMLTPQQAPRDLVLGQKTEVILQQLEVWNGSFGLDPEVEDLELEACGLKVLIGRRHLDRVFTDLDELVTLLGGLREERKNVLLLSDGWVLPRADKSLIERHTSQAAPQIGVTTTGKLTTGRDGRGTPDKVWCERQLLRLAGMDFEERQRTLLHHARGNNVAFYPTSPTGLVAPVTAAGITIARERADSLRTLADNTDGVAIVETNDLAGGLKRVANDLESYYVLGYYTSNTTWDGLPRTIAVRLKTSGEAVRARRGYRAPTEAEMAAMRKAPATPTAATAPSAVAVALAALTRLRPEIALLTYGSTIGTDVAVVAEIAGTALEQGRWRQGANIEVVLKNATGDQVGSVRGRIEAGSRSSLVRVPVGNDAGPWTVTTQIRATGEPAEFDQVTVTRPRGLFGTPLVFRTTSASAAPLRPVATFQFSRTERLHIDVPVHTPLDRREARVLDRNGRALPVATTLNERESANGPMLGVDVTLAPLAPGDYVLEITGGSGSGSDRTLLAIRVVR